MYTMIEHETVIIFQWSNFGPIHYTLHINHIVSMVKPINVDSNERFGLQNVACHLTNDQFEQC